MPNSEEAVFRGEYTVIRTLIRVLEGGVEGKRQVDTVIDKCSSMQNLREAIATYRNNILRQSDEMKRAALLSFFVEYLERYYYLICFSVYLHTERAALDPGSSSHCSFYEWMKSRPELYTIIQSVHVRYNIFLLVIEYLPFADEDETKGSFTKIVERVLSRSREIKVGNYEKASSVAEQHRLQSKEKAMVIQWLCFTPPSTITDSAA